ncbi:MAG: acyltransferase family protein [Pseudanabaenaceae cyanobacterium]|jgi:peptidoglycan/LPS O-acetylase OafA/YrhL
MALTENRKHLGVVDGLRGIAALMVVIVHASMLLDKSWFTEIAQYGQHGVIIFFVISGFIIPYALHRSNYRLTDISNFLWRRILRLNPPYYLILLITLLFYFIVKIINPSANAEHLQIEGSRIFFHLTYLVPFVNQNWYNNVFWTLAIEFQYYILIALLYPLLSKNKYLVIFSLILLSFSHHLPYAKATVTIINYSTPFLVGILIFLYKANRINRNDMALTSLAIFWLCQMQISGQRMLFAVFACGIIMFVNFTSPLTNFLGKISYSLYLTHSLFLIISWLLLQRVINLNQLIFGKEIIVFLLILLSIPVAYGYYLLIEKPSINWAKRFKKVD